MNTFKKTLCPMLFALYLLTFFILNSTFCITQATIHYVSHAGSNIPPYLTWEDAADSIQAAIIVCSPGDTVIVSNGVYNENIFINKTINLWGSSADSTIVVGPAHPEYYVIRFDYNNSSIKNFQIRSPGNQNIGLYIYWANVKAENCRIRDISIAIGVFNSSPTIENSFISNFAGYAISDNGFIDTCKGIYRNNIILSNGGENPVHILFSKPTFANNIIIELGNVREGFFGEQLIGLLSENNLISGSRESGIYLLVADGYTDSAYVISNNVMNIKEATGAYDGAIVTRPGNRTQIRNNIIKNAGIGIWGWNTITQVDYNLFSNVQNLVGGTVSLGDSNIIADPMFVNDTIPTSSMSFDFHLQAYSPAIDAGDPDILDVDGTRSDIGMFGGPGGEYYKYLDLPPRTPQNFRDSLDLSNKILFLNWDGNSESDFRNYNIYRDTIAGFTPNEFNLIAQTDTSYFADNLSNITAENIYYRITAVDSQDNESQPGNEIAVLIVGVNPEVQIVRDYILYQNYPNPFNPSTTISYEIKARSYVKLMVYDIKGELILVLVNKEQQAGYYEVEFNLKSQISNLKSDLASGIYLYRIEVIGKGNIPVYSDMKKMILIK